MRRPWSRLLPTPDARRTSSDFGFDFFIAVVLEGFARMSLKADTSVEFATGSLVWKLKCALGELVDDPGVLLGAAAAAATGEVRTTADGRPRILIVEDEALPALEIASRRTGPNSDRR